ncbi:recombinase family protein [Streptomyces misionensis]|uniref:recombinase family protein n=1 Tax=Streptomyces misionensis TaxID=67331 RepID=UPI003BAFEEFD
MEQSGEDPSTLIDLFCRKSRGRASKGRREISISAQETRGRLAAEQLGLKVRHVWREVGSASRFSTRKSRTDQDAALAALERGETGALWLFRMDRWDRRGAGSILRIIEPEDGRPRRLLFDNGDPDNPGIGLDSSNPRDRKELIRRAEEAREETEVLSERVRTTKTHQRANGEWVNRQAPYGLKVVLIEKQDEDGDVIVERKLAIDDAPAGDPSNPEKTKGEVAFDVTYTFPVKKGLSDRRSAMHLNEMKIPSPSGGTWAYATVRDMINNPVYAGWQIGGRQEGKTRRLLYRDADGNKVSVMHGPALLTDEQQREAQDARKGPAGSGVEKDGRPHNSVATHLLSDLLRCAGCGSSMPFSGTQYACWRIKSGKPCPAPAIAAKKSLEEFVHFRWWARLTNADPDDDLVVAVADRWAARVQPQATADSKAAMEALGVAERRLARVWADRRAGHYDGPSEQFFAADLKEANEAVDRIRKQLEAYIARRGVDVSFLMDPESCTGAWEAADVGLRRALLRLAIDKITVCKAPYNGARFKGFERTRFTWVDGVED